MREWPREQTRSGTRLDARSFLRDVRGLDAGTAALGFAAFSVTMTVGRLAGEAAIRRAGPVRVLRFGGLIAATGVLLAVLVASPAAGMFGFGLVGLGMCCMFPLVVAHRLVDAEQLLAEPCA